MEQVLKVLEEIFRDNFDDDNIVLSEATTASDIEEWDSMEQVNLITLIEEQYNFKFTVEELTAMSSAKNVGDMVGIILEKLG